MKTIWKFELDEHLTGQVVQMPAGAQVLSATVQDSRLCVWAIVDPSAPKEGRVFDAVSAGSPVREDIGVERRFIGTVPMAPFVWHVFERL